MRALSLLALASFALVGCGAGPHTRGAGAVTPLEIREVAWNPSRADVGPARAVADAGSVVAVLGDRGAAVLASGAVVAQDASVTKWAGAAVLPGADGSAAWVVGVDGAGHVRYLRGLSAFEDVSARYGLDGRPVHGAASLGDRRAAFLLDGELAVADGQRVTRFAAPGLRGLAGGPGWAVGVGDDRLQVFDAAHLLTRTYPLHGVLQSVVGADGRVYAATPRALYAMSSQGVLELLFDAQGDTLHGLAASGERVWFADGAELGTVEGDHVAETAGAKLPADAALAPSASGDVWVVGGGAVRRFTRAVPEAVVAAGWTSTVGPVFARACASCHQPGGSSGTDLSTVQAWQGERDTIRQRVLVSRSMPPEGHPISDADRAAIAAWVGAPPR